MSEILFLCLARDCETTMPTFFSYLERLAAHGFRCSALIGENGSRDNTRRLIEKAPIPRVALLDTSFMTAGVSRLERMAIGRQALLEAAKGFGWPSEYICVADLDNVIVSPPEPPKVQLAIKRLRHDSTLFAVGATSSPVYYDLLSLRAEGHDYHHLNRDLEAAKGRPLSYFPFHKRAIYSKQRLATKLVPLSCASSFNGFCVYNTDDYLSGSYRSADEANVCEHVTLNCSIGSATGKHMIIAPELTLKTPADHAPVGLYRFWRDRISERMR